MRDARKLRVLFLCTGNSCRSQMAEGWARALRGDALEAFSAGTAPKGLDPLAVRVMAEAGVDLARHVAKRVEDVPPPIDVVVTVCDAAHEACPAVPGARVVHAGFEDPPRLAANAKHLEEALAHYRRVRDEIRHFVEALPGALLADAEQAASPDAVRARVREGYAKIARGESAGASSCGNGAAAGGGGCCGPAALSPDQLAAAIGYSQGDLAATPEGANLGLSCGNPTAMASLAPGEVVLDLGSGGGFDCFVAGPRVGAAGRVIGIDMTPDMLSKARRNLDAYRKRTGLDNVEFRLGEIENLPVADSTVDVVLSNCVLNLSPDKARVWREIARVLKPGGRVAVSDLALLRPLPDAVRADVEALVGCVAGAVLIEESRRQMASAGLTQIVLTPKPQYVDALTHFEDPLYRKIAGSLPAGTKASDFITSLDIEARKPN